VYDGCFTTTFVDMVGQMGQVTITGNEAKSKIWTQVVVICGPTHYQLDHKGDKDNNYVIVVLLIHNLTQYKYIIINSS